MLKDWPSHQQYQENLRLQLLLFYQTDRERVVGLDKSISKLYQLNPDALFPIVFPLYSNTGRPAKNQPGIIPSLILMLDQDEHDIPKWAAKVASDHLLCAICGFEFGDAPAFSSYYDLIRRLWQASQQALLARKRKLRTFKAKPRKKLKAVKNMFSPNTTGLSKNLPPSPCAISFLNTALRLYCRNSLPAVLWILPSKWDSWVTPITFLRLMTALPTIRVPATMA